MYVCVLLYAYMTTVNVSINADAAKQEDVVALNGKVAALEDTMDGLLDLLAAVLAKLKLEAPDMAEEFEKDMQDAIALPAPPADTGKPHETDKKDEPGSLAIRAFNQYHDVNLPIQHCRWACGHELTNKTRSAMYAHQAKCLRKSPVKKPKNPKK